MFWCEHVASANTDLPLLKPSWEKDYGFVINKALICVLHHNQSKMKCIFSPLRSLQRLTLLSPFITPQVSFSNQTFIYCHLPFYRQAGKTYFSPLLRPSAIVEIISRLRMQFHTTVSRSRVHSAPVGLVMWNQKPPEKATDSEPKAME